MKHITLYAGLGKTLKRISDGADFGNEITLGYTYYIGGKKLEEPLWELPEHYEKVDAENLRIGEIFKTEEGKAYTITSFDEEGKPVYTEGEIEIKEEKEEEL